MAKVLALLDTADRYYEGSVYTDTFASMFSLVGQNHPYSLTYDELNIYEGTGYDGINDNPPGHTSYFVGNGNFLDIRFGDWYGETEITDMIFGFLVNVHNSYNTDRYIVYSDTAADMLRMGHDSAKFYFWTDASLDSDLDTPFPINQWKYLEYRVRAGVGDGQFRSWVDGALIASKDTVTYDAANNFNFIRINQSGLKFTDMYIIIGTDGTTLTDSDRLGPIRVTNPSSATSSVTSNWDGSDGNSVDNYLLINETLPNWSSTDYVSASTAGDQDTYRWSSTSVAGRAVSGVYLETSLQRTDINPASASLIAKSSTDLALRPDIQVPLNYTRYGYGYLVQPDGSTWTSTGLADAEFGVQVRP